MHPLPLVVGIATLAVAVAQYLSASGRLDLTQWPWPFVTNESRAWQVAYAGLLLVVGLTALVIGAVS